MTWQKNNGCSKYILIIAEKALFRYLGRSMKYLWQIYVSSVYETIRDLVQLIVNYGNVLRIL